MSLWSKPSTATWLPPTPPWPGIMKSLCFYFMKQFFHPSKYIYACICPILSRRQQTRHEISLSILSIFLCSIYFLFPLFANHTAMARFHENFSYYLYFYQSIFLFISLIFISISIFSMMSPILSWPGIINTCYLVYFSLILFSLPHTLALSFYLPIIFFSIPMASMPHKFWWCLFSMSALSVMLETHNLETICRQVVIFLVCVCWLLPLSLRQSVRHIR